MRSPVSRSRRDRLGAVLLAGSLTLALAACGGESETPVAERPTSQPVEGATELAALWPLTGEPVESQTPEHPVLVVKIDNSASSSPQVGLGRADLVTQEMVEGGSTRLAAMYYQDLPEEVGPVRSMRATDIGIAKPAHGVIIASGGGPPTVERMRNTETEFRVEDDGELDAWTRSSTRRAPYDLMVDLRAAAEELTDLARVPASYLPWGDGAEVAAGDPARRFEAVFSPRATSQWAFADGTYRHVNSLAAPDDQFAADSVLVLRVEQTDAGYLDPAGFAVPESIYEGEGEAVLFHGGRMVEATWVKGSRRQPLRLRDAAGEEISVPAGNTWVELLPRDADGGSLRVG